MATITLWHGGGIVERPAAGIGQRHGDFGEGFYCAETPEAAEAWACDTPAACVSRYSLETEGLRILDLRSKAYCQLHWLALVLRCRRYAVAGAGMERTLGWLRRTYAPDPSEWDAVVGYGAGGSIFACARAFADDAVSYETLCAVLDRAEPQWMLRSPQALAALRYQGYAPAVPEARTARCGRDRQLPWSAGDGADVAADCLGEALDYAVNACHVRADDFFSLWSAGPLAEGLAWGDPWVAPGMSGTELAMAALRQAGLRRLLPAPRPWSDSPERWCGGALARLQRHTGRSFRSILAALSAGELLGLAPALRGREAAELMELLCRMLQRRETPTALQTRRRAMGLSQRGLAEASGVSLRMIQQYEQRAKELGRASGSALLALSRALTCRVEDLLETP